jgi:hypothetical protein
MKPATLRQLRVRVGLVFQSSDDQLFSRCWRRIWRSDGDSGARGRGVLGACMRLRQMGSNICWIARPHHLSLGRSEMRQRRVGPCSGAAVYDEPSCYHDPRGGAADRFAAALRGPC